MQQNCTLFDDLIVLDLAPLHGICSSHDIDENAHLLHTRYKVARNFHQVPGQAFHPEKNSSHIGSRTRFARGQAKANGVGIDANNRDAGRCLLRRQDAGVVAGTKPTKQQRCASQQNWRADVADGSHSVIWRKAKARCNDGRDVQLRVPWHSSAPRQHRRPRAC
jgi:hypothetical protein